MPGRRRVEKEDNMWLAISMASAFALMASIFFVIRGTYSHGGVSILWIVAPASLALLSLGFIGAVTDKHLLVTTNLLALAVLLYGIVEDMAGMGGMLLVVEAVAVISVHRSKAFAHLDNMFTVPASVALSVAAVATIFGMLGVDGDMVAVLIVVGAVCALFAWGVWHRAETGSSWRYVPMLVISVHTIQAVLCLVPDPPLDASLVAAPSLVLYTLGLVPAMLARDFHDAWKTDASAYNDAP